MARVGLVVKRSVYEMDIEGGRRPELVRLLRARDRTVSKIEGAHREHVAAVEEVQRALAAAGAQVTLLGRHGEGFDRTAFDLVVTVGGDGTLLAASHAVTGVPMLAVNSAPSHSVGFFCGAKKGQAAKAIGEALDGRMAKTELTRMSVSVNGQVVAARVLNDALYCHASPAATTRYLVKLGEVEEEQKSSGFWIGPAAGSTAAQRSAGGRVLSLTSRKLQLVVREPYAPNGRKYKLTRALVQPGELLTVRTKIHEAKLFFDGPDLSSDLRYGDVVTFRSADDPLVMLGLEKRKSHA